MLNFESFCNFFIDSRKIYAICYDMGHGDNIPCVISYMHLRLQESSNFFDQEHTEEIKALKMMLGYECDLFTEEEKYLAEQVNAQIKDLDRKTKEECGLENLYSSELGARLKLFIDSNYKNEMFEIYNKVSMLIPEYTDVMVEDAFIRKEKREKEKEEELMKMLEL